MNENIKEIVCEVVMEFFNGKMSKAELVKALEYVKIAHEQVNNIK